MADEKNWPSFPIQLPRLPDEVDRLFDQMIHRPWGFTKHLAEWNPSIDLYETPEAFILEVDLPGVKREGVKVEVEGQDLILQGERTREQKQTTEKFHYHERFSGKFMRRMTLPKSVDKEKIEAEFTEGVLRVMLPKTEQGKEQE